MLVQVNTIPLNPFVTTVAVIAGVITAPLVVTGVAGALGLGVAGVAAAGVGRSVCATIQAIGAAGLSFDGTGVASATGGITAGVITTIATKNDQEGGPTGSDDGDDVGSDNDEDDRGAGDDVDDNGAGGTGEKVTGVIQNAMDGAHIREIFSFYRL